MNGCGTIKICKSGNKGRFWLQTRGLLWHTWLEKLGSKCGKGGNDLSNI